jgi:hypothetical protein
MYQWSSWRHTFGSRKWWVLSAGGWAMTGFPGYFTKVVPVQDHELPEDAAAWLVHAMPGSG